MNDITMPTEQDLVSLRSDLEIAKRKAEYEQLKKDLKEIYQNAKHTPNEFEGVMQLPDTEKVLRTKRRRHHFFELFYERLRGMFSIRAITGNIIALLIAGVALFYIFNEVNMAGFEKYQNYFAIGIQIFAAIQIIKSATRGLLLPFLALVIGASVSHSLGAYDTLLHFNRIFYQHLMITGIIGFGVAVLSID